MPAGFCYAPDVIDAAAEARLVGAFADLPFKEFEFHGFLGKRRVVSFGLRYDFNGGGLQQAAPIPPFVLPARARRRLRRTRPDRLHTLSSPNTGRARQSAGIATGRTTTT